MRRALPLLVSSNVEAINGPAGLDTSIEDVGKVATEANVDTLALSHLAPAFNPRERWLKAADHFTGRLIVGDDGIQIGVGERR